MTLGKRATMARKWTPLIVGDIVLGIQVRMSLVPNIQGSGWILVARTWLL